MNTIDAIVLAKRRLVRRMNWAGGFVEFGSEARPEPRLKFGLRN